MMTRLIVTGLCFVLVLLFLTPVGNAQAGESTSSNPDSARKELPQKGNKGIWVPLAGIHVYWKDGLRLEGRYEKLKFKIGGRIHADGGYIGTDNELETAFPDIEGGNGNLRRLRLIVTGTAFDFLEFKLGIGLSDVRSIKDNWIGFKKIPFLGRIKVGHMKEPFSLEELSGADHFTFMERGLPTNAIAPSRNLGIMCHNSILDGRTTWAVGGFWDVGSFDKVAGAKERIENSAGVNVTGRVTGVPWYEEEGRKLVHLGLSYSHQFRDAERTNSQPEFDTRPESYLTDERLVDTGLFSAESLDLINPEFAIVFGPFSLQAEYFHVFADAAEDLGFWGFYVYTSYALTGENKRYNASKGTFSGIKPNNTFNPFKGGWGALEAAFRYSYLDLNDQNIRGGKESNFTVGLNWYPYPKIRLMFNYVHARVMDRDMPSIDDGRANIFMSRFQFHF